MESLTQQFTAAIAAMQNNMPYLLALMAGLWLFHLCNWLLAYRLNLLGIYPRSLRGIVGIIFSPFLHADFNHLFFNSIPMFVLANFILLSGWHTFFCVSLTIIILGGFGVWLFGRRAIHIGASGMVMGYWSYLLIGAYQQGTLLAIVLAGVCLFYFGGLALNLFPTGKKFSWEGHVFGFLAGIVAAFLCPVLQAMMYVYGNNTLLS